tara:strand:+ start:272 stop:577 length:306 start_codon:yes stop_codon:yes gene_type:complete
MEFGYIYLNKNGTKKMTQETAFFLQQQEEKREKIRQENLFWKNIDRLVDYKIMDFENEYIDYDIDYIYDYYLHNDDDEYDDNSRHACGGANYNSDSDEYSD